MKRFSFRLERLLAIRRYREREWEMKLAEVTGQVILLQNKIKESREQIGRMLEERGQNTGKIDIYGLISNEMYIARMKQTIETCGIKLESKKREREAVQKKFLEASKEKKILEKLKQRKAEEYYNQAKKEEFKVVDEINTGDLIRKTVTLRTKE
jgi:flagellar FliJ protein